MKSPTLLIVAATFVFGAFAWKVLSAPIDQCPSCKDEKKDNATWICAQEESKFQGSFESFCEMLRFNCINKRSYYVVTVGERCRSEQAWAKIHNVEKPVVPKKT